jgi:hypothetical protein
MEARYVKFRGAGVGNWVLGVGIIEMQWNFSVLAVPKI